MIGSNFRDVTDNPTKRLSDSPLGKLLENFSETLTGKYDSSLAKEETNEIQTRLEDTNPEKRPTLQDKPDVRETELDVEESPINAKDVEEGPFTIKDADERPTDVIDLDDVPDNPGKRLSDSPLGKLLENFSEASTEKNDADLVKEETGETSAENPETKETRELNDEEKQRLRDAGMSENNIEKCRVGEDGTIYLDTINSSKEGQEDPETGVKYVRKQINVDGMIIEGVFPEFDSAFDCQLPDDLREASDAKQEKECNAQLQEAIKNDPDLAKKFSPRQLEMIKNGETPQGYTWHHNEETGRMQLVKTEDHMSNRHTGGKSIWGGGQDSR